MTIRENASKRKKDSGRLRKAAPNLTLEKLIVKEIASRNF